MTQRSPYEQLVDAIREHSQLDNEQIIEAATYGADAGVSGFIYTEEAAAFFDRHAELIWNLAVDQADDFGEANPLAMIAKFGRSDMSHTFKGLKTLMSWFALEEAGRYLENQHEERTCV